MVLFVPLVTASQGDVLDGIKKDNFVLTDAMNEKLSKLCEEFTTSFTP